MYDRIENSVYQFIDDCFEPSDTIQYHPISTLHEYFVSYCGENQIPAKTKNEFSREFEETVKKYMRENAEEYSILTTTEGWQVYISKNVVKQTGTRKNIKVFKCRLMEKPKIPTPLLHEN